MKAFSTTDKGIFLQFFSENFDKVFFFLQSFI